MSSAPAPIPLACPNCGEPLRPLAKHAGGRVIRACGTVGCPRAEVLLVPLTDGEPQVRQGAGAAA